MNLLQWLFGSPSDQGTYIDEDDDLRILSHVGEGAFGTVSLVRQESTGKLYAAKKGLRAGNDLATEIGHCLSVDHRNVAKAFPYYYDEGEGSVWILTEFAEGPSLFKFIQALSASDLRLSVSEVAWLGREIALGLHAIHRQGLLHRDLSCNNVILSEGRPVIIDFGLAKESFELATGTLCGTPNFMAPEAGFARATPQSDIFSLGALLYYLLFQRLIQDDYGRGIALDLKFRKRLKQEEEPLVRIIEKAISLNPGDRHTSARQMATELKPMADRAPADSWWSYHCLMYQCEETCGNCENPLPGRAAHCPHCGEACAKSAFEYPKELAAYPCAQCESGNSVNWTYCFCCGEELE